METPHEILSQLKFISKITPGSKINVEGRCLDAPGWMSSISRWLLFPGRRKSTYEFLTVTFQEAFRVMDVDFDSGSISKRAQGFDILRDIHRAIKGIDALMKTYADDVLFCCSLEALKESVLARVLEVETGRGFTTRPSREISEEVNPLGVRMGSDSPLETVLEFPARNYESCSSQD